MTKNSTSMSHADTPLTMPTASSHPSRRFPAHQHDANNKISCCVRQQPLRSPHDFCYASLLQICLPTDRYPCQNQGAMSISSNGHSTVVGRVRFNADGTALLSTGAESGVVLQHSVLALAASGRVSAGKETSQTLHEP